MTTTMRSFAASVRSGAAALCFLALPAAAQLSPEWTTTVPVGTALSAGMGGYAIDAAGITYMTGTAGAGPFAIDVVTVAFDPQGNVLWQSSYDGPEHGFDQASAIALGPGGVLYVSGDTQGPDFFANVLLLKYDAATGALLDSTVFSSGPQMSEYGGSVAVDALGGVYVVGGTVGDGTDALMLKFDAACDLVWKRTWDGAGLAPYSLDSARYVKLDPNGDPLVLIHGVTASNQPDFVVTKLAPATGDALWLSSWGDNGGDTPRNMEIDASGDVYVSGTSGFFAAARFATIRLRGSDGALLWQAYDKLGFHDTSIGLALDGQGVYVTGTIDPDTDESNDNDNIYTFKRSTDGALLWTHQYGGNAKWQRDQPSDVAADPAGHVFVGGWTNSPPYLGDVITLVLDAATGVEVDRHVIDGGPDLTADTGILDFDADFDLFNGAGPVNATTGGVTMSLVKFTTLASPTYRLVLPPLTAGTIAKFAVKNATPLELQFLGISVAGTAQIPLPPLGATLGLAFPQLLVVGLADASGSFAVGLSVPSGAVGITAWFQALQMNGATPVVKRTVQ